MMERVVIVDGKEVRLRASAAMLRMYRIKFRRDLVQDMSRISAALKKSRSDPYDPGKSGLPIEVLGLFEDVAYLMAKHADPAVPNTVEEWLDGFGCFSIYTVFPVMMELWADNMMSFSTPAKK